MVGGVEWCQWSMVLNGVGGVEWCQWSVVLNGVDGRWC